METLKNVLYRSVIGLCFKKRRNDVGLNQGETVGMERCDQIRDLKQN